MKSPLLGARLFEIDSVDSTQNVATESLQSSEKIGAVLAQVQTEGRGRFGRTWLTGPDDSLTVSFIFHDYAGHPRPYLVGMAVAIACAGAVHCQLRWPNDLFVSGKKLGGILTELVTASDGKLVPVVGVGINLSQKAFPPELDDRATSLAQHRPGPFDKIALLRAIVDRMELLPEPTHWSDLAPAWALFDDTPGKRYRLPTGEEAVSLSVGPEGQLLCAVDGESTSVMAADAILGQ